MAIPAIPIIVPATQEQIFDILWYDNINIQSHDLRPNGKVQAIVQLSKVRLEGDSYIRAKTLN